MHILEVFYDSCSEIVEAVIVSDGQYNLLCFAWDKRITEDMQLNEPLLAMMLDDTSIRSGEAQYSVAKSCDGHYAYQLNGKLISKKCGLVEIGKILIEINSSFIPGDIKEADFISFFVERLDLL